MEARAEFEARSEALVFLGFFADFPDPRQPGKVIYPLEEIFLLCLLAVLAGAETVVDIARFGQKKIELLGPAIRAHWMIENGLHLVLEMNFRDDECRVRTDHAPAQLHHYQAHALNLIRRAPSKDSIRLRRKVADWNDDFLASLISA
jgi:hypothetical protein